MIWALRILATLLPILYGMAGLAYVLIFLRDNATARHLAPRVMATTVGIHALYLALLTAYVHRIPIATSFEMLTFLALCIAVVYLFQEHRSHTPHTGVLFVPLIFVVQTISSAFIAPDVAIHRPFLEKPIFGLHITSVLLGYSSFAVSAIYGALYVLLYRELRAQRFGLVFQRLPPLDILSDMNFRAAAFGLSFLTLAIGAGALMSLDIYPQFWQDPKPWLTALTWMLYALVVMARYAAGWRGPKIAWFTIIGFLLAVFSMLAVNRLFPSFHDFRL
jgi:ABC-type uncharacterized transport system permease subunit